jgi:hypothetical protein
METTQVQQGDHPRIDRGAGPSGLRRRQIGDMVSTAPSDRARVTVVPAPACHFCEDAEHALAELASAFRFEIERVPAESAEGLRLIAEHRPALTPLVLVDGAYFSAGRLPRKKLIKLLTDRSARLETVGTDAR